MRLITAILATLLPLAAQPAPKASELLSSRLTAGAASIEYTSDMNMEMSVMGNPIKITTSSLNQFAGAKYRIESKTGGAVQTLVVYDGSTVWTYLPAMNRYTKTAVDTSLPFLRDMPDAQALQNAADPHGESLEVDGLPRECWVTESHGGSISVPGQGAAMKDVTYKFWVDKQSGVMLKSSMSGKMELPGMDAAEMRVTNIVHDLKLNPALPDAVFQFTPPDGAQEGIPGMPGGAMIAGLAPPPSRPAAPGRAPAGRPAAGEPQAYVPSMWPVNRDEPAYPKNAQGSAMVEVLLTIDPAGHVTNAEALAGPAAFRQPALDAVRTWSFRPVLREGQPVFAYTDTTVNFMEPGKGPQMSTSQMNIAEEMASGQRLAELRTRFPRSLQQEFADLEQQASGGTEMDRSFRWPQLAKAAIAAGALDKAAVYANEMLRTESKDPNYGQNVHDGNMVLGLIALRQGNVARAAADLLAAGKSTGSAPLNSFGPNMTLAKELLEKGEREAVLAYFEECRAFWKLGAKQLDAWTATVRGGGMPDFGANLVY